MRARTASDSMRREVWDILVSRRDLDPDSLRNLLAAEKSAANSVRQAAGRDLSRARVYYGCLGLCEVDDEGVLYAVERRDGGATACMTTLS